MVLDALSYTLKGVNHASDKLIPNKQIQSFLILVIPGASWSSMVYMVNIYGGPPAQCPGQVGVLIMHLVCRQLGGGQACIWYCW